MAISDLITNIKDKVSSEGGDAPEESPEVPEVDALAPDPAPARKTRQRPTKPAPPPAASSRVRSQVADSLTMLLLVPATAWAMRDPVCGGQALAVLDESVKRAVPIVVRNPAMLRFFTEGTAWMEWMALASALSPLASVVWTHHVVGGGHRQEPEEVYEDADYSRFTAPPLG